MTPGAALTCRELVEWATDYAEGALPAADLARLEAHLADCPPCLDYLDQLRRTVRLSRTLAGEVPPDTLDALRRRFRDWRAGRP